MFLTSFAGSTNEAAQSSAEHLLTRSYKISVATFAGNLMKLAPPKKSESNQELLRRFFKESGVKLNEPAAVFLNEKKEKLFIRATQNDQDKIEALIRKIQTRGN